MKMTLSNYLHNVVLVKASHFLKTGNAIEKIILKNAW